MAFRQLTVFASCVALVVASACASNVDTGDDAPAEAFPSVSLLEGNFARAPFVFEIDVQKVKETARFRSDSGKVGYIQYSVTGTIIEVLKANEEHEFPRNEVEYFFTQEYDPSGGTSIDMGRRYLVFLMLADDPPRFWPIGNGAQFEISPQLSETMRQISAHK